MTWTDVLQATPPARPIYVAGGCAEPAAMLDALAQDPAPMVGRVVISGHIPRVNSRDPAAGATGARLRTLFPCRSGAETALLPWSYAQLYEWLATPGTVGLACCQLTRRPNGQLCLGLSADFMPALIAAGAPLVGQVNPDLPALPQAPDIPEDRFTALFEARTPLPEYDDGAPDAVMTRIGAQVAALIRPGDRLQLGLGKVQAAVIDALLADPRPLSLHGGMLSGRALPLLDSGQVASVTTGVFLGTARDYARAPDLTQVRLVPVSETHGRAALGRLDPLVTVNAALSVDLAGQATGESINGRTVSAPGGLTDFHRAARAAPRGRAVLALRSRAPDGSSTIVAEHPAGTRISLGALDADIIVTEHGVAHLRQCDTMERASALIAVAAPEHRDALSAARNH